MIVIDIDIVWAVDFIHRLIVFVCLLVTVVSVAMQMSATVVRVAVRNVNGMSAVLQT